ncbi:MAG TPA: PASTA domain-containing protein [Fibrobacteria bacterium]|nr:PASTA domain-containing protein [Fibrobacteria bacterium]HOX52349.1 PASTA domain-containing protein [Fibrobacteria bacterium]
MKEKIQRVVFHMALAAATLASLGALGWIVADSFVMPWVAHTGWEVVAIPDLTGLSADQATEKLAEAGLDPVIDSERRRADRIGPDLVALQRPAPGDSVKKGHVVRLWLSAGPSTVPVPDLSGQDSSEAFTRLEEAGLVLESIESMTTSRFPMGKVARTEPQGGTLLVRGSSVKIIFSLGSDSIPVDTGKPAPAKVF